jgi:hypothetical protein
MIVAVDFDGTCVEHMYPLVGEDAPGAVETSSGSSVIDWRKIRTYFEENKKLQQGSGHDD